MHQNYVHIFPTHFIPVLIFRPGTNTSTSILTGHLEKETYHKHDENNFFSNLMRKNTYLHLEYIHVKYSDYMTPLDAN